MKRKKNRIRPFPFFKMSGFFPFFVRFLKKLKTDCVLKNGKLPENCRKIAGKLPEKKRKFQKTEMDGSVFQISVFFKFAFFFRQFSGNFPAIFRFSKTQSVFCYLFFLKKTDKKRKKNGNFKKRKWTDPVFYVSHRFLFRFFSGFFPAFFKKSGKMPEKNGFIFFRQFAFRVRFWVKNGTKTGQNPENPYED